MKEFNAPFFQLYENIFLEYSELHGTQQALRFLKWLFSRTLEKAYSSFNFTKGNINHFAKLVRERDENVGLRVELPLVTENKIIYQFHQDPFPNLKTIINAGELDNTYIEFKINFLLGNQWSYHTTQHIWDNAPFTEHVITKKWNEINSTNTTVTRSLYRCF